MSGAKEKTAEVAAAAPPPEAAAPSTAAPATAHSTRAAGPQSVSLLPPEHWTVAPATDDAGHEDDSALGPDVPGSTASVSSTVYQFRTIMGRTYHSDIGDANYW